MRRVVFRCDASRTLGGGHVARCLTLAAALAGHGWDITFATNPESDDTVPALAQSGWRRVATDARQEPSASADCLGAAMAKPVDLLVVDHYGLDVAFERACRLWARTILAIDDLADRPHDCDLLLDALPGRASGDYAPLVPPTARLLLGTRYALLRPGFARVREASLARRDGRLRRLLVCLGASDPHGITPMALQAAGRFGGDLPCDVIAGSPHEAKALLPALEGTGASVSLHVATDHMAELMAGADLAIGSAGGLSWERCTVGLPVLLVVTADNQRSNAATLLASGAALDCGDWRDVTPERIGEGLARCAAAPRFLETMAAAAAALCDGRGVDRVAGLLQESVA